MNKKLLIMIVAGLLVGVGGTAGFFILTKSDSTTQAEAPPPEPPGIMDMEPFLVNISDEGGDRFAKLDLRLAIRPGSEVDSMKDDTLLQAKIRDRVLTLITSKSFQELVGPVGKEALRRELKAHLSPLLEEAEIDEVLFADFVVQ